jgi:hypothetical protein
MRFWIIYRSNNDFFNRLGCSRKVVSKNLDNLSFVQLYTAGGGSIAPTHYRRAPTR